MCLFLTPIPGGDDPILTHIFVQSGWFNHQLDKCRAKELRKSLKSSVIVAVLALFQWIFQVPVKGGR